MQWVLGSMLFLWSASLASRKGEMVAQMMENIMGGSTMNISARRSGSEHMSRANAKGSIEMS